MTPSRPIVLWALVGVAATLAAAGWCYAAMTGARDAAARSARELAECDRLVAEIRAARGRAPVAVAQDARPADLAALVEAALRAAEVPAADLTRVAPDAARRAGDGDYEERPTRLSLRNLTVAQALKFLQATADANAGLSVDAVRLVAAKDDVAADAAARWNLEATVSTLVYVPRGPSTSSRASAPPPDREEPRTP